MARKKYVVDPDGADCYGKYEQSSPPIYIPNDELVEVNDLSQYQVVEWRYESF